jgi:hypothetical protein
MSETEVSASFQLPAAEGEATLRYAFAGCEIIPVNAAMSLAINAETGAQSTLAPDVLNALAGCSLFDTLDGHTQTICRSQPALAKQRDAVRGTLEQLASSGLLVNADTIISRLQTTDDPATAATRVVLITADRPALLERLLESLLQAGSLLQHDQLVLIDDSQSAQCAAQNADLVERFNIRSARDMRYVGASEQQELADTLRRECPQHAEAIAFLLDAERWPAGQRYGRARSLALLLTVGYRAIVLDDDILCRAYASPFHEDGLRLGSSRERMALFHTGHESLLQSARPLDESPLALHASALGHTLGSVVRQFGPLQLGGSAAAAALTLQGDARVLLTQCGSWGDPGTADPHWALHLRRDAIERLAASGDLRSLLEARSCWFGCTRPTLMKAGFMSQMTGLDNSQLLPPYFPAFRGEDQVFGSMLNALYPHGAILEFDWGVPHLPAPDRAQPSLREPIARRPSLGLCARLIDSLVDYRSDESAEERLAYLALQLRRLTRRSASDVQQMYRAVLATARAEQLQRLTALARETAELPSQTWQGYVRRALEELQTALATPVTLADLGDDGVARLGEAVAGFADVLDAWPALRRAAAQHPLAAAG